MQERIFERSTGSRTRGVRKSQNFKIYTIPSFASLPRLLLISLSPDAQQYVKSRSLSRDVSRVIPLKGLAFRVARPPSSVVPTAMQ
jgi:hypothetical protein